MNIAKSFKAQLFREDASYNMKPAAELKKKNTTKVAISK
jgi:hypothetical protein